MSAEDRNGKVSTDEECTPREHSFDKLTKGLASATVSRRGALRLLAGALLGGALASAVPERASAHHRPDHVKCLGPGNTCVTNEECCSANCELTKEGKICGCPLGAGQEVICGASGGQKTCICKCTGNSCPNGCCQNEICQGGTTVQFCGTGGNTCVACNVAACQICDPTTRTCVSSCTAQETCIAGACCPNTQVCGNTCLATACDATQCQVCDPAQNKCVSTCGAQETCIAGVCCPNTSVCGNTCLATACDATQCQVCDPAQNKCVSTCTTPKTACESGVCVCPQPCSPGEVQNPDTCECETVCPDGQVLCPGNNTCVASCTAPKVLNPESCQCECPTDITCTDPKVVNPNTCECGCPNTCTAPLVQNPTTCECLCPAAQQCGSNCCSASQVCCPPGTTRAGECRGNLNACRQ